MKQLMSRAKIIAPAVLAAGLLTAGLGITDPFSIGIKSKKVDQLEVRLSETKTWARQRLLETKEVKRTCDDEHAPLTPGERFFYSTFANIAQIESERAVGNLSQQLTDAKINLTSANVGMLAVVILISLSMGVFTLKIEENRNKNKAKI